MLGVFHTHSRVLNNRVVTIICLYVWINSFLFGLHVTLQILQSNER